MGFSKLWGIAKDCLGYRGISALLKFLFLPKTWQKKPKFSSTNKLKIVGCMCVCVVRVFLNQATCSPLGVL